jgi:hypothetical protein
MDRVEIIRQIDVEISRLQQARALLSESDSGEVKRKPGRPSGRRVVKSLPVALPPKANTQPRRKMSTAGRARIAAAMKMRWAKVRSAAKKATTSATKATQKPLVAAVLPKTSAKKTASKKAATKATKAKKSPAKKGSPAQTVAPSTPSA